MNDIDHDLLDARLRAVLTARAEEIAAGAPRAEQVAAQLARRLAPRYRFGPGLSGGLRLAWLVALAVLLLALAAWLLGGQGLRVGPARLVTIGVDLPLGATEPTATQILYGIRAAVHDAGGRAGGFAVAVPDAAVLSDVSNGAPDTASGTTNIRLFVADPAVVAVIGPFDSGIAAVQIPITNGAGLLQCSPGATDPALTDPSSGAASRPNPERPSFVRTVATDSAGPRGAARYLRTTLGKTQVYVIDSADAYGLQLADAFQAEFAGSGTVVGRGHVPTQSTELDALLTDLRAKRPPAIYVGGSAKEASKVASFAAQAGLGGIPIGGGDALLEGTADVQGSFLNLSGEEAARAFAAFPGVADPARLSPFVGAYRAELGPNPSPYAAAGYACAQVVMAALQRVDSSPAVSLATIRERVRAEAVDPANPVDTILGRIGFDVAGDMNPQVVSIFAVDPATRTWRYQTELNVTTPGT